MTGSADRGLHDDPYRTIGIGYARHRRPDARIARQIVRALGNAESVLNVGAGAGSYEPRGRRVTAVEPSSVMIAQRPPGAAPVVRARAESLPFPDRSFDAAMAILTVHHWRDAPAGLAEMRRVSGRQIVLTWDPAISARFWLVREYLPEITAAESRLASLDVVRTEFERQGARVDVVPVPVPADCTDGFLAAYWRRPASYLDPGVRAAVSALAKLDRDRVGRAMERLSADLSSGRWHERHADLLGTGTLDAGYRLVTAG
ncbi:class I SAM-dependent methyltransferase [Actinomadura chokoriensis]|uniref:Class I SAM-dependent methyltransferase n=1 Tax=Actinomadura chokoriensis TaxID=454156 RepID=A0ABV4R6I6_9ACTN